MLWLAHTHPPAAAVGGVRVDAWLRDSPCLCIAYHAHVAIVALARSQPVSDGPVYPPLATVATVPLNGRALALQVADGGVAVLTDHPDPHVLFLFPKCGGAIAKIEAVPLADPMRPAAELGMGLIRAGKLLAHSHRGVISAIDGGATPLPLAHPTLISMAPVGDMIATLSISSIPSKIPGLGELGDPVLSFHTVHGATLAPVPWSSDVPVPTHADDASAAPPQFPAAAGRRLDAGARNAREQEWARSALAKAHVPLPHPDALGAHLVCGAAHGVLVFSEESILFVPAPADATCTPNPKRRCLPERGSSEHSILRIAVSPQTVVAATAVDAPGADAIFARSDGQLYAVSVAEHASIHIRLLAAAPPAAGPQGVAYLGDGLVYIASAAGDSTLLYLEALVGGPSEPVEINRWPNIGPAVDMATDGSRIITCSGGGPTCSLRVVRRGVGSSTLAHVDAPGVIGVSALGQVLCLIFADGVQLVDLDGMKNVTGDYAEKLSLERPVAGGVSENAYVSSRYVHFCDGSRWEAPDEILAAAVGTRVAVATVDAVHVPDGLQARSAPLPFQAAALAFAGDMLAVAPWDSAHLVFLDSALSEAGSWTAPSPITALAAAFDRCVLVGLASGDVVVLDVKRAAAVAPLKSISTGSRPVELAEFDAGVIAYGDRTVAVYADGAHIAHSTLRYKRVRGAAQLHIGNAAPLAICVTDRVDIIALDSLQQLDIRTVALGDSQPTSLSIADCVAVTTRPSGSARGTVRLLDRATFAQRAQAELQPQEHPNCAVHINTPVGRVLVVGTGFPDPDRIETPAGRLIGFDDALNVVFALDVHGNVYAVQQASGFVAAATDSQVQTFAVESGSLRMCDRWGCAFIASCLVAGAEDGQGTQLVVGDAMRSLTVLRVDAYGQIEELSRENDPYWTTAVCPYSDTEFVGSDIAMNIFFARRMHTKDGNWSHSMRRTAGFHYGDMINRFVWGGAPRCLRFCTAGGALGVLLELDEVQSSALELVQSALVRESQGGIAWDDWRTLRTEHRVSPAHGVIDGDFITREFGDAARDTQERIVALASSIARRREAQPPALTVDGVLATLDKLALHL